MVSHAGHSRAVDNRHAERVDLVRRGYDALSLRYRSDDAPAGQYEPWISELVQRVPGGGAVLDVGCGCGVPVARDLHAAGYRVTGVDVSQTQIDRARQLVPAAEFICADVTTLNWPAGSFDALTALYSIIHIPLAVQPELLAAFARWLVANGLLLLIAGASAWTGSDTGWLGGNAEMWWSHADAQTYRGWLADAGFLVVDEQFIREGDAGHSLFWARRSRETR